MANPPKLRGIPFNQKSTTDSSGFAPVYDPRAIRYGEHFNFWIRAILTLGIFGLYIFLYAGPLGAFSTAVYSARDQSDLGSMLRAVFFSFALPLLLVILGLSLPGPLSSLISFDLQRAYRATADELRDWLSTAAGSFSTLSPKEELKETLSSGENVLRSVIGIDAATSISTAAKLIAREDPEPISLFSREGYLTELHYDSKTHRYIPHFVDSDFT